MHACIHTYIHVYIYILLSYLANTVGALNGSHRSQTCFTFVWGQVPGESSRDVSVCHMGGVHSHGIAPIAGWFSSGKIPSRNGWWLGVSPFMEIPFFEYGKVVNMNESGWIKKWGDPQMTWIRPWDGWEVCIFLGRLANQPHDNESIVNDSYQN